MKPKTIAIAVLSLVGVIALPIGCKELPLAWKERYAVKEQNIDRKVFKETRSFNEAKVQELSKYRLEYLKAKAKGDVGTTGALRSTIQHTFAAFDRSKLEPELQAFLAEEIFNY